MTNQSQKESDAAPPRVFRSGTHLILIRLSGVAFTLFTTILIARQLGVESYGRYSFIFAIVTLASIPTQMGMPDLVVRETVKAVTKLDLGRFRALLHWGHLYIATSSTVMIGAILGWSVLTEQPDLPALVVACLLIPLIALGNLRGAALRGLGHDVLGQLPEYIIRPMLFFASAAFLATFTAGMELYWVFVAQSLASLVAFLTGFAILKNVGPKTPKSQVPKAEKSKWRSALISFASISGLTVVNSSAAVVMLGIWSTDVQVGQYRLAAMVGALFTVGLQTMTTFSMSHMSRYVQLNDKAKLTHVVQRSSQFSFALAVTGFLIALFVGPAGLEWIFGAGFAASFPILLLLAGGHLTNAFFGPVASLLTMSGSERTVVKLSALGAGSNILLNLILIPTHGAIGAAVATAVSIIGVRLALFLIAQRKLAVSSWPLAYL